MEHSSQFQWPFHNPETAKRLQATLDTLHEFNASCVFNYAQAKLIDQYVSEEQTLEMMVSQLTCNEFQLQLIYYRNRNEGIVVCSNTERPLKPVPQIPQHGFSPEEEKRLQDAIATLHSLDTRSVYEYARAKLLDQYVAEKTDWRLMAFLLSCNEFQIQRIYEGDRTRNTIICKRTWWDNIPII